MEKNKFARTYLWVSLVFVVCMAIITFIYLNRFPSNLEMYPYGYNGVVEKTLFNVTLTNLSETIVIFNWPLIIHFGFFVLTILNVVNILRGEQLEKKIISEVMVYNAVLAFVLVLSSGLFIFFIPEIINGVIDHGYFLTKMPRQMNDIINVYNLSYVVYTIYFLLNAYALYVTAEKKVTNDEEFNEGELFL